MDRLKTLETKVKSLYEEKDPNRADWADWMFDNHVLIVANYATELAKQYGANEELSRTAALLHDIADAKMKRENEDHEKTSLQMARELMKEFEYAENEIKLVVDDAIRYHSCNGSEHPDSLEGKILSTADALAHLKTDFYIFAAWAIGRDMTIKILKQWVLDKIERDLHKKNFF